MHHQHRFEFVIAVLFEPGAHGRGVRSGAPVGLDHTRAQTQAARHFRPEAGEVAGFGRQHLVAGAERVHQRRLPGARSRSRKNDHRAGGLEHLLHAIQTKAGQFHGFGAAVIDGRLIHRAEDAVRDVGRAGDLKKMSA